MRITMIDYKHEKSWPKIELETTVEWTGDLLNDLINFSADFYKRTNRTRKRKKGEGEWQAQTHVRSRVFHLNESSERPGLIIIIKR